MKPRPYAGKSVLQAIGEQHGLGFLMADGTLTVAQASVISGTDSDPRFEQYYALLPEKQPDVILYDDAEVRDMAEFHAWIEQHFTITDRYTVQHGTASLRGARRRVILRNFTTGNGCHPASDVVYCYQIVILCKEAPPWA